MTESCEEAQLCRKLLATFLRRINTMRARWFPIVGSEIDGLYTLLGLPFHSSKLFRQEILPPKVFKIKKYFS